MNQEQWIRVQKIFAELSELPSEERPGNLDKLCEGDEALRREVASLLAFHDRSESFLERPAMEELVGLLGEVQKHEEAPQSIGDYRVGKLLGKGGMGSVYMAEREGPEPRRVALKVINFGADLDEFTARFKYEHRALAMMDHQNVARVFDAGATRDGRPYFTLEFVEGPELTVYCDRQKLSLRDRLTLFLQVCSGVDHAHVKGVIHRDLKPSNILVCTENDTPIPKIIDFGIAKIVDGGQGGASGQTVKGTLLGTPAYMSPEQADFTDVDTASDVYSLGAVLYHVLAGKPPFDVGDFEDASLNRILRIIREQVPEKPSVRVQNLAAEVGGRIAADRGLDASGLVKELSGDLDLIVLKALEKDPQRRYRSVADFAEDLHAYLDHKPISARSRDTIYLLKKFVNRHRNWVMMGAFLLIAVMFGYVGLYFGLIEARSARDRALKAEEESRKAAEEAVLLNVLITEMLDFADPKAPGGGEDVADMLDIAEEKVALLEDKPQYYGGMMLALGKIYLSRNDFDKARVALDKALTAYAQLPDQFGEQRAKAHYYQALCLLRDSDYVAARPLFESTVAEQERLLGPDHPDTMRSMRGLADTLTYLNEHEAALTCYDRILERQIATLGEENVSTQVTRFNRANCLAELGRIGQAGAEYQQTLLVRRRLLPENHPHVLSSLYGVARTLYAQGHYRAALDTARESYTRFLGVHGVAHTDTAASANLLALCMTALNMTKDAELLFNDTLEGLQEVVGENHHFTLIATNNLADFYKEQGELDKALNLKLKELKGWRARGLPEDDPNLLYSKITLGQIYHMQKQYGDADVVYRDILAAYRKNTPGPSRMGLLLSSYGTNLMDMGLKGKGQDVLKEALDVLGENHHLSQSIKDQLEPPVRVQ